MSSFRKLRKNTQTLSPNLRRNLTRTTANLTELWLARLLKSFKIRQIETWKGKLWFTLLDSGLFLITTFSYTRRLISFLMVELQLRRAVKELIGY